MTQSQWNVVLPRLLEAKLPGQNFSVTYINAILTLQIQPHLGQIDSGQNKYLRKFSNMTFWFQELVLGLWFVVSLVRLSQFLIFGVTLSMRQAVWIQQGLWAVFKCRTVPHWYVLHTVSFDWFSTGLGWIINLEDFLLKLL